MGRDKMKPAPQVKEQSVTYADYAKLPDEGIRYEINNGQLEALTPGPNAYHQLVVQEIEHNIRQMCSNDYIVLIAPIDLVLAETEVRQPDVVMIHRDRLSMITKRGIEGPPDLVVEVLSPHTAKRDRLQKLQVYAAYRIPEYWIVDVNNELLEQYLLEEDRYELTEVYKDDEPVRSPQLTCISFSMAEIMASIPKLPNF